MIDHNDNKLKFMGVDEMNCSIGTIKILQYCKNSNIEIPIWLKPKMVDWVNFTQLGENKLVDTGIVVDSHKFIEIIFYIMDELNCKWAITDEYYYVVETKEDAMALKLWWS